MYSIVLAGGYAKRLWPLTLDTPKPLLPIGKKPVLDYTIEKLQTLSPRLSRIVLSTNQRFQHQFQKWLAARTFGIVELVPDDSIGEEQKPGAVRAMANIVATSEDDDVLVLAGDGMFNDNLSNMIQMFREKNSTVVALYEAESLEEAKRCGTVVVDQSGKVLKFAEKPDEPSTTLVCGAIYAFPKSVKKSLEEYMAQGLPTDQPGYFIEWLCGHQTVYGYMLKSRFWDIGTSEAYRACNVYFSHNINKMAKSI